MMRLQSVTLATVFVLTVLSVQAAPVELQAKPAPPKTPVVGPPPVPPTPPPIGPKGQVLKPEWPLTKPAGKGESGTPDKPEASNVPDKSAKPPVGDAKAPETTTTVKPQDLTPVMIQMEGCVTAESVQGASADTTIKLTPKSGLAVTLTGSEEIRRHVGGFVLVTGAFILPPVSEGAAPKTPNGRFDVREITVLSVTCP
jgi:hypothetical protein